VPDSGDVRTMDSVLRTRGARPAQWLSHEVGGYAGLFERLHDRGRPVDRRAEATATSDRSDRRGRQGRGSSGPATLSALEFTDTYLFYVIRRGRFLSTRTDQDISMSSAVRPVRREPDRAEGNPLRQLRRGRRTARAAEPPGTLSILRDELEFWPVEHLRDTLYEPWKRLFSTSPTRRTRHRAISTQTRRRG